MFIRHFVNFTATRARIIVGNVSELKNASAFTVGMLTGSGFFEIYGNLRVVLGLTI
jgi:hypothetical protein